MTLGSGLTKVDEEEEKTPRMTDASPSEEKKENDSVEESKVAREPVLSKGQSGESGSSSKKHKFMNKMHTEEYERPQES